jgi:hypothetical protein
MSVAETPGPVGALTPRATPGGALRFTARDWAALVPACGGAGVLALAISVRIPYPALVESAGVLVGLPALVYMATSRRYGVTLSLLALYMGLLDGFLKLRTGVQAMSLLRDALIAAIVGGAAVRVLQERRTPRLPPLTPWVVVFTTVVVLEAFNPNTLNGVKVFAGLRQHLEWVPLFFFGFALLRSKDTLRNLAILIGAIAAINGLVSLIQFQLTPDQMAAWGPGYAQRISGGIVAPRLFVDLAGDARVRPFALGSDMGYAGAVGVVGAPMVLALLATGKLRTRSWLGALMGAGIVAGIMTSQSRSAIIGSIVAVLAFFALGIAGARVWRAIGALAVVAAIAWLAIPIIVAGASKGTFDHYASIAPNKIFGTTYNYRVDDNSALWHYVSRFPLGGGLGMTGPARAYGAQPLPYQLQGESFNSETNFNFLTIELGVPGLVLWTSFAIFLLWLATTRLRSIPDRDVRTYLAGAFAPCFVILGGGLGGPTMSAPPFAPWFWLTAGMAAYWLSRSGPPAIARARGAPPPLAEPGSTAGPAGGFRQSKNGGAP